MPSTAQKESWKLAENKSRGRASRISRNAEHSAVSGSGARRTTRRQALMRINREARTTGAEKSSSAQYNSKNTPKMYSRVFGPRRRSGTYKSPASSPTCSP